MSYCGQDALVDYFNSAVAGPDWPVKVAVCPFVQGGAGIPGPVLSLVVFGVVGMTLSYRVQHPGPVIVAGFLTAGAAAASAPGAGINIVALVFLVAIAGMGLYLYQRFQSSL